MHWIQQSWWWLPVAVVVAGCTAEKPEEMVLLRVGQEEISLAEFQRAFDEAIVRDEDVRADSASARRFLRDYTSKTLLEQIARDSLEWLPLFEHRAVNYLENLMVQKMREDAYGHAARLSTEELHEVYEKGRTAYKYRELPFETREEALQMLMKVREGAAFFRMVERRGGDPGGAGAGWRTVLDAPEAIIDVLAELGTEEVGGPVEADGRYWLVQLLEKEPNPSLPPFEDVEHGLRISVARERGGRLLREFRQELLTKYAYQPRMAEVLWMTDFLGEATADVPREYQPPQQMEESFMGMPASQEKPVWTECPLDEEDQKRLLSVSTVDSIEAVLLLDHLNSKPSFTWPTFTTPEHVLRLLEELAIARLERFEAWERGYDQNPDLAWAAEKQRNLILTRQFVRQHIYVRTAPTVEEARRWYESRRQPGDVPGRRRYIMVEVASRELAEQAAQILQDVEDPQAAFDRIQALDPSASWLGPRGFPITEFATDSPLDREVFQVPLGGVTRPHPVGARFAVARVEEILMRGRKATPFEQVKGQVVEQLAEARIDSVFQIYLRERREITPIEVDEEVFGKIRYDQPTRKHEEAMTQGGAGHGVGSG